MNILLTSTAYICCSDKHTLYRLHKTFFTKPLYDLCLNLTKQFHNLPELLLKKDLLIKVWAYETQHHTQGRKVHFKSFHSRWHIKFFCYKCDCDTTTISHTKLLFLSVKPAEQHGDSGHVSSKLASRCWLWQVSGLLEKFPPSCDSASLCSGFVQVWVLDKIW